MKVGFFRDVSEQAPYTSGSQNARAWSERWVRDEMYCPNCGNLQISQFKANRPVADFLCQKCSEEYEIKSQKSAFGTKVLDGAFRTMCERLDSTNNPNLVLINYDLRLFSVTNALLIPKHFFVRDIIEERPPLAATARRAWIGCNILLNRIPQAGRIFLVRDGEVQPKDAVLAQWKRTLFLRDENSVSKGWLMEVMRCVDLIGKTEFSLSEVYAFEDHLSAIYPSNRFVKQKIRQQLQVLRDHGYLDFISRGNYRKRAVA